MGNLLCEAATTRERWGVWGGGGVFEQSYNAFFTLISDISENILIPSIWTQYVK